jgi:hypothetical protein
MEYWSIGAMERPEVRGQMADKTGPEDWVSDSWTYPTEFCLLSSVFFLPIAQHSFTPALHSSF